jgi:fumarate reductase flavoprotein subunit
MTERDGGEFDGIVVGGGLAGLTAAQRLAASGRRVALVEKRDRLGGSSALSGGWFALSGTALQGRAGVDDSDELFLSDMRETGGGYADEALLRALVGGQGHAIEAIDRARAWTDELKVSAGMTVARAHLVRIRDLLAHLESEAVAAGVVILAGRAAERLVVDGSRVVGVESAGEVLFAASGVVLASGGFSRSRELLELFVPDQAAAMPYGGVGNTGDGLRMAWMLGAGLADIGHVSGTYGQHAETTDDEHELLTANYLGAILVNARGERFADESQSYKVLGSAVLGQPGRTAFQVFDAVVRARSRPGVPLSDMERLEELGHLVSAPTIPALAAGLGIRPEDLERTVARYNQAVATGAGDAFGRTGLVNGVGALTPIATPPFFAYAAVTAMTSTFGGLRVAPDAGVERMDGTPIEGLYAAGEVAGGFHGASYMTGTALTKALVFGVTAADAIVAGGIAFTRGSLR